MSERWYTGAGVRAIDRIAAEQYGIPSIVLMENAAVALREASLRIMTERGLGGAMVVCGPGNNGGDGFALARHLANAGVDVRVGHTRERSGYAGDARTNLEIIAAMGLPLTQLAGAADYDGWMGQARGPVLIVDALLGTGVDRAVEGAAGEIIGRINGRAGGFVLAADLPSGLDADHGAVHGPCVRADATVTFVGRKVGMAVAGGWCGAVTVGDIGVPPALAERMAVRAPC
jgi:NAD(P)H-hydrate epimerase